jgi:HlyD family secretion protein
MRRYLLPSVCLLLAGLATACSPDTRVKPDGSGTIECTQVQVPALAAGRILSLTPREGGTIKAGQVVAKLDSTDYELRRDELRAVLAQAQAQLDLMQAGSREEDIRRARAQLAEAQASGRASRADVERMRRLFATGTVTRKQLDDAQALDDRAAAATDAAARALDRLANGNRAEEIRIAQAQVAQAKARIAQLDKAVADCTVVSPVEGFVTARNREDGEYAATGAPLLTVSRLDEVWLSLFIPETRLGKVKLGQPAWVRIDGMAETFEGTVTFVAAEAEFTPRNTQTPEERAKLVYRLRVTLRNPHGIFKPGMPADGYLEKPQ